MVVFGSSHPVTVIGARGTADERTWQTLAGGDFSSRLLLQPDDRVQLGDEVECELFDQTKIVGRVDAERTFSGVSHWVATLIPRSEWVARNRPATPHVMISGDGSRVNIGTVDQSTQIFHRSGADLAPVLALLNELRGEIAALGATPEATDAALTVQQLEAELRRSNPETSFVWRCVDRLNSVGGLAEKVARLTVVLRGLVE